MAKGGRRSTSYTPTWKHGKTRTIRVPIALAEEILKFAKERDEGVTQAKDEEFWQAFLAAFDCYIEEESQRDRKGNQYGKEFKAEGTRWYFFSKFKEWVKAKINQAEKGD